MSARRREAFERFDAVFERNERVARAWMREHMDECTDAQTGIANLTQLAEGAAEAADRNDWCDDPDHPIWEWAAEEAALVLRSTTPPGESRGE